MSTIRRQSIVSSLVVYFGFALGFLNTYLFTRQGGLTKEEFGLTNTFIAIANIMFSVACLGMPAFVGKFFPYYKSHLPRKKNDQLTIALFFSCIGFLIVTLVGLATKHILIDVIFRNSPELPKYFYWTFIFGFGFTLYMVMEAYAWQQRQAVLSNFLKEVLFRAFTTVLIVLTTLQIIKSFDVFIGIYSFTFLAIVLVMFIFFFRKNELHFTFTISNVTRKFRRKIIQLASYVWAGSLLFNIASVFDTIVIAAVMPNGMAAAGIYALAQNISSLIQAPQRAIISSSVGPLSQAWKEKDYAKIDKVYHRSSINQLVFSCAMFCLIWLNFDDGITTFHLQEGYRAAKWVFFFIGIAKIVDMGTGLNSQIIGTSTYFSFEFTSGMILLALTLPLNWQLTRMFGIIGPAYSNLISFTIFNIIRYWFLLKKFKMQPFTVKSVYTIVLGAATYFLCYWLFNDRTGFGWIVLRSTFYIGIFATGMFLLKLTPDAIPVLLTLKKKLGLNR
ncbi:MAG: lipopolysaccharide biosynthesis protein [Flavisolibacter sp.]